MSKNRQQRQIEPTSTGESSPPWKKFSSLEWEENFEFEPCKLTVSPLIKFLIL